jgi:hypothetical protein
MAQNNQVEKSIVETAVSIEPVAVVYNLENDAVENFVYNYLNQIKGVEGIAAARLAVVRDGNRNPELSLYVFIDQRSKEVFTSMQNVPEHLRRKMDVGGYRASEKLHKALLPIVREYKIVSDGRNKLVYVKLDVFKVLGLMLAADPRKHNLIVTEVLKLKKGRSVTTVIKSNRYVDKDDNRGDKYLDIIERHQR